MLPGDSDSGSIEGGIDGAGFGEVVVLAGVGIGPGGGVPSMPFCCGIEAVFSFAVTGVAAPEADGVRSAGAGVSGLLMSVS